MRIEGIPFRERDRWAFFISLQTALLVDPGDSPSRTFFSADSAAFAVIVIDGSLFGFPVDPDGQIRTVVITPHAKSAGSALKAAPG
jgi:hypothetical protein